MSNFSLVLETNNLRSATGGPEEPLTRLLGHLTEQSFPIARLGEVVVTHDGLSERAMARLEGALGRKIAFVHVDGSVSYYQAKNLGVRATTSDVVVFADADCWPDRRWLEALTIPFTDPSVTAVAGRTTYRNDALGIATTAIDFPYLERGRTGNRRVTRNFYANNVAFRREVLDAFPFGAEEGFYRGNCQTLGLRLAEARISILFAEDARTVHRFPDTVGEFLRLRIHRGRDMVLLAPRLAEHLDVSVPPSVASGAAILGRAYLTASAMKGAGLVPKALAAIVSAVDFVGAVVPDRRPRTNVALRYGKDVDRLARTAATPGAA